MQALWLHYKELLKQQKFTVADILILLPDAMQSETEIFLLHWTHSMVWNIVKHIQDKLQNYETVYNTNIRKSQ